MLLDPSPTDMLPAPFHETVEAVLCGHGYDLGPVAVSDEPSWIDLGDDVPQTAVITRCPGRKNDNAIHAMLVGMGSCFLHAGRARQVASRASPIVDFSFQINQITRTPGVNSVTHRCLSQSRWTDAPALLAPSGPRQGRHQPPGSIDVSMVPNPHAISSAPHTV